MSIIRVLSNPEHLYIYEAVDGNMVFIDTIHAKEVTYKAKEFKKFVKAFEDSYLSNMEWENLSIEEKYMHGGQKVILKIYDVEFEMWYVTWDYISRNTLRDEK